MRRVRLSADRRRGSGLALRAKIGASVVVKGYQNWEKFGIAARQRRFFTGGAERLPDIYRGGEQLQGQP